MSPRILGRPAVPVRNWPVAPGCSRVRMTFRPMVRSPRANESGQQMYTHILIPTDGSPLAGKGLDHGLSLAKKLGSKVTILYASEPPPPYIVGSEFRTAPLIPIEEHREGAILAADEVLGEAKRVAEKMGLIVETVHTELSPPAEAIVKTASDRGCNLIVMASHGRRGLGRLLLGSQTLETVTNSPVPVLVVR